MANAFKKNDLVTYISDWDRHGTVTFRHAVVYSCGKKQMVLTDAETGEEMGRHFRPEVGEICGTFPRMTDEEATAKALEAGKQIIASEIARIIHVLERYAAMGYSDAGYIASMNASRERLEASTARGVSYAEALAVVKAATNAAIAARR